jgi:hypothetical protein
METLVTSLYLAPYKVFKELGSSRLLVETAIALPLLWMEKLKGNPYRDNASPLPWNSFYHGLKENSEIEPFLHQFSSSNDLMASLVDTHRSTYFTGSNP